jgi:phosphorylcholine metabolism protein LicD
MTHPTECGFTKIGIKKVEVELVKFKQFMDDIGVEFFLTAGVLLGIVRDGELIKVDKDFDFGVMKESDVEKIRIEAEKRKYYDEIHYGLCVPKGTLFWLKKYIDNYVLPIEIQVHYVKDNYTYYNRHLEDWKFSYGRLVWKRELFENLAEINFKGIKLNIPNPAEDFLVTHYGEDWKTPKEYSDWRYHCKNIYEGFWV